MLCFAVFLPGCKSNQMVVDEHLDWGAGVRDPDYVREKVIAILSNESILHPHSVALGMLFTLDWHQACYVYRTSPSPSKIKEAMCIELIQYRDRDFEGLNKKGIVKLIGPADEIWEDGTCWVYTGRGTVSDSLPGIMINFDEAGMFSYIGYPN
jgi:hypothetical protein